MTSLELIPGTNSEIIEALQEQGFDSAEAVAGVTVTTLTKTDGVGRVTADVLADGAEFIVDHGHHPADELVAELAAGRDHLVETIDTMAQYGIPPTDAITSLQRLLEPDRDARLLDVNGVGPVRAHYLLEAGYETPEAIAESSPAELERVTYTGPQTSEQIHRGAKEYLRETA